jgi:hypothetical protein
VIADGVGAYLPTYLQFDINFQTFVGDMLEIAPGLTLRLTPGHTPGLCTLQVYISNTIFALDIQSDDRLQVNLPKSGTWIFTSDQYIVKENYGQAAPQGWLARDFNDWVHSHQLIRSLQKSTNGKLVFGHCLETFNSYKVAPEFYE